MMHGEYKLTTLTFLKWQGEQGKQYYAYILLFSPKRHLSMTLSVRRFSVSLPSCFRQNCEILLDAGTAVIYYLI